MKSLITLPWGGVGLICPLPQYNPATVLLGIYPNELKTCVHIKTGTYMFMANLFIIPEKTWKQQKYPLVCDWINKLWHIQTIKYQFSSVAQLCLTLWPHGLQHARLPCLSTNHKACWNSCPLSWWCHLTISSSVVPFSSRLQSFPASGSFQMSQLFTPSTE